MKKVALAITGLLLALGGGAHGKTLPAEGPSPWCEGHPDVPTGTTVTASAGVERGGSAVGVYACYEIMGSGSRPTSGHMLRLWLDPVHALVGLECVPTPEGRVQRRCYEHVETPIDDDRRRVVDGRHLGLDGGADATSNGIELDVETPGACPKVDHLGRHCVGSHRAAARVQHGARVGTGTGDCALQPGSRCLVGGSDTGVTLGDGGEWSMRAEADRGHVDGGIERTCVGVGGGCLADPENLPSR